MEHVCAVQNGAAKCWGRNFNGQLGKNDTIFTKTPTPVLGLDAAVTSISCGPSGTCAVAENGTAFCWGINDRFQTGDGVNDTSNRLSPVRVAGLINVDAISCGAYHTCATVNGSTATYCWGWNRDGNLGNSTLPLDSNQMYPVQMNPDFAQAGTVTSLSAGYFYTCAVDSAGAVNCVGANYHGQLGVVPVGPDRLTMGPVIGLPTGGAQMVSAQASALSPVCAVMNNGEAYCWGRFVESTIGNGTLAISTEPHPVRVFGDANHHKIALGYTSTCSIRGPNKEVWCWGYNQDGQLGNGSVGAGAAVFPQPVFDAP